MDFKQLKAFLMVAETGNVTKAAEMLYLVQPAVSRQIRLLEDDIGKPLFQRERHGMTLTSEGQALVGYARRAMLELERARAEIGSPSNGPRGLVTLGLLPSTVETLASPLAHAIAAQYPGIQLRISMGYAGTLRNWLQNGEIDAALLYGAERFADLDCTPLVNEALWIIGPGDSRLRADCPVPLRSLTKQPLVMPSPIHGIRSLVEHACATAKVELNIAVETNSLSVQRCLVMGGHGVTILPPLAVAEDLRSGQLSGAPLCQPSIERAIVLALPSNRPTPIHVRKGVEILLECTREAVDTGTWPQAQWLGG